MGLYELVLRSEFPAAHSLRLRGDQHEPVHKHDWRVEVFLEGRRLDDADMVADFTVLQRNLTTIVGELRDRCLNELPAFSACHPSAERVAKHLHDRYRPTLPPGVGLAKVRVWETGECAAAYIPTDTQTEKVD